uniref:Tetratricopeptide repeat protein 29 n=1 Tax=Diabrotica virgifera virgifera TaxID=50390 RepID=A0A6P7GQ67_DIAVI
MSFLIEELLKTENFILNKAKIPETAESSEEVPDKNVSSQELPTAPAKRERTQSKYLSIDKKYLKNDLEFTDNIKRERLLRKDTVAVVQQMRNTLPKYTISEIREFRLPYHEALIINLQDSGFLSASSYVKDLIDYQENMRKSAEPGSNILILPQIKFAKEELVILSQSLKAAEQFHFEGAYSEECQEFLNLAVSFGFGDPNWWWLGEQLILQSIRVSSEYSKVIGHKYEALSRYAYARFLMDNVKEFQNAEKQLRITRNLTQDKVWTGKTYFPEERGTLYMQTNRAIFDCLLKEVKAIMGTDVEKAIILADQARRRAAEACFRLGETKALVLKGICELEMKRAKSAINSFLRALGIQERWGTIEGICKIKIHLAKAYLMDNCTNSSLRILMELKDHAEANDLPFYLGQAYKNLGEYYLLIGDPDKATPLLDESIKIFLSCKDKAKEANSARHLRAISAGLQLFPKYIEVLLKAGKPGPIGKRNLASILAWKNNRTDFWSSKEHIPYTSCDDIIVESVKKVAASRVEVLDAKFLTLSKSLLHPVDKVSSSEEDSEDIDVTKTEIAADSLEHIFTQEVIREKSYEELSLDEE